MCVSHLCYLKVLHHCHHLLRVGSRNLAAKVKDTGQLSDRNVLEMKLNEMISKGTWQDLVKGGSNLWMKKYTHTQIETHFSSTICPRRILCPKQHEVRMSLHQFHRLGYKELTVIVKHLPTRIRITSLQGSYSHLTQLSALDLDKDPSRTHHHHNIPRTLFNASRTSVGARFNSSKIIQWPFFMAVTSTPICIISQK